MKQIRFIPTINDGKVHKYEICDETKITKKYCKPVIREVELLALIHSDLGDLKNTLTGGGKRFYMIFIDDYS